MAVISGHCGAGPYSSGAGKSLGSRFTTSWPGNARLYGDWQLLTGATYSHKVFTGGPTGSSANLPGDGLNLGVRPVGAWVCTSGTITGQFCRQRVTRTFVTLTYDGVTVGYLTEMRYDDDTTWNPNDCRQTGKDLPNSSLPKGISRKGDSGGAAYHATGSGTVVYDGWFNAQSTYRAGSQWRCLYYFGQPNGIAAHNASITW